jgi:signal transduction histidine kinase
MEELALTCFPLPHVFRGAKRQGAMLSWSPRCGECDKQCESSKESGLRLCSYGVNYQRVDDDLLVAGFIVRDYPGADTPARRSMLRKVGREAISRKQLEKVLEQVSKSTRRLAEDLRARQEGVIAEYQQQKGYEQDVVELLRPDLQNTLAQVHDYKQFVQQIVQNLDVILEERFPRKPIEEKLELASHEEKAIYWAAKLMDEKLDTALYLVYPERITEVRAKTRFQFHGLVTKYLHIYQPQIDAKGLKVRQEGRSYGWVEENSRALSIIPHAFIDNAIKYAPPNSKITLEFLQAGGELTFSVESLGPRIYPDEEELIFQLFKRGREAEAQPIEGTGFGLGSAGFVAQSLGVPISVEQDDRPRQQGTRMTKFTMSVPLASDRPKKKANYRSSKKR